MLELILIAVVAVVVVGYFKGLRSEDRGAIIRSAAKATAQGVAYSAKTIKVGTELAYTTGNNLGKSTELELADQLKDLRTWERANTKPVQDGVAAATKHLTEFGAIDALAAAKAKNKELDELLIKAMEA